jgi:two-component SAPR family response regulator
MSKTVFLNVYKLKKGINILEFKEAVTSLHNGYISKFNGYVSFELMQDKDRGFWSDRTVFETMEDAQSFAGTCEPNQLAEKFYGFINLSTCRSNLFLIEESYY